ncbi:MAG: hypothetical protein U1F29_05155 [Planctomycetota bacterium]
MLQWSPNDDLAVDSGIEWSTAAAKPPFDSKGELREVALAAAAAEVCRRRGTVGWGEDPGHPRRRVLHTPYHPRSLLEVGTSAPPRRPSEHSDRGRPHRSAALDAPGMLRFA